MKIQFDPRVDADLKRWMCVSGFGVFPVFIPSPCITAVTLGENRSSGPDDAESGQHGGRSLTTIVDHEC